MEGQKLTIIKKKGKGGGAGHHGGSWKVAFADFMTAMMAFFLLMWLLSMGPQKKKEELANYFKTFSLFGDGGIATSSVSLSDEAGGPPQVSQAQSKKTSDTEGDEGGSAGEEGTDAAMEEMKAQLERDIQERLTDVKDQIVIGQFDGGLKIDIMDKAGLPMFELGSTELTDKAKKILQVVADNIKHSTHKLEIEGHTDAVGYSGKQHYGNWELSTARASAARIELERDGISSALLVRVSGYADTEPIIKDDPFDPRNRRISLRLLYPKQPQKPPAPPDVAPSPIQPEVAPSRPSIVPPLGGPPATESNHH